MRTRAWAEIGLKRSDSPVVIGMPESNGGEQGPVPFSSFHQFCIPTVSGWWFARLRLTIARWTSSTRSSSRTSSTT